MASTSPLNVATHRLRFRRPLAMGPLLRFLGDRAIPGVESFDGTTFRRAVRTPNGSPALIHLTPRPDTDDVALGIDAEDAHAVSMLVATARRLLDLDTDPGPITETLGADPSLAPLVRAMPGIRLPGTADGFELSVRAILGQQVSVRAARTFAGRLVEAGGTRLRAPDGAITHLFPSAEQLLDIPLGALGLTTARVATLRQVAELVASDALDLSGTADRETTAARLLDVPGIGPWTVAYVSMRALGDRDAFPVADLGVRLGFDALGLASTPAAMLAHAERWRPWRAYAVMHLWNAH